MLALTLSLCDTENLSTDQIRNIFMEKSCSKYTSKAGPRPFFNFGKYLKIAIACKKSLLK